MPEPIKYPWYLLEYHDDTPCFNLLTHLLSDFVLQTDNKLSINGADVQQDRNTTNKRQKAEIAKKQLKHKDTKRTLQKIDQI